MTRQVVTSRPDPTRRDEVVPPESWLVRELGAGAWRTLAALLLAGTGTALYLAQRLGSQFFADDFLYLAFAREADVDLKWFNVNNYGHFAPLTRLAYLLEQRWFGLDYPVAAVLPALLGVVIVAGVLAVCRRMVGQRVGALALALIVAQSMVMLRVTMWWGASVHVMGAAAAYVCCIAAFVAYCRTRQFRYQVLGVGALAAALLVQERPLVVIGYLVLIRYLFRCGLPWRQPLWRAVPGDWALWLPYVLVTGVYLWWRLFEFAASPTPASTDNAVEFVVSGIGRSFLPAVVGVQTGPYSEWVTPASLAGAFVLVGAVVLLALVRRSWWRVVAFVVVTYLANMTLMALGRPVVSPVAQSQDLQYYLDPLLTLPIALALGLGCLPVRERRARRAATDARPARAAVVLLTVTSLALFVSNAVTWRTMVAGNNQTAAHEYFGRALPELRAGEEPIDLLRLNVRKDVIPGFIAPYNDQPGVFALDHTIADRLDSQAPDKVGVMPDGQPTSLRPVTLAQTALTPSNVEVGNGASVEFGAEGACLTGPPGAFLTVALGAELSSPGLYFGVRYSTAVPELVRGTSVTGDGPSYNWNPTALRAGSGRSAFDRLDAPALSSLLLLFEDGVAGTCMSDVWVGGVAAERSSGGCSVLDFDAVEVRQIPDCVEPWPFVGKPA